MRTCEDCNYIKGNECIRYNGPANEACGLITGAWYKVDELIAALICGNESGGDSGGGNCDQCMSLLVQVQNYAFPQIGGNVTATLTYKLYSDPEHNNLIISRGVIEGKKDTFSLKGSLPYTKVYPAISTVFSKQVETDPFYTSGYGVDMLVVVDGKLFYARSMVQATEGERVFTDFPAEMPTGFISIYLSTNQYDTNSDAGGGLVAVGGDELSNSEFIIDVILVDGGEVAKPTLYWPVTEMTADPAFDMTNYDVIVYDSVATSMTLLISGQNNEGVPLTVSVEASVNAELSFSEQIAPGENYHKEVNIPFFDAYNNDFTIFFQKNP